MLKRAISFIIILFILYLLQPIEFKGLILIFLTLLVIDFIFDSSESSSHSTDKSSTFLFNNSPSMIVKIDVASGLILQANNSLSFTLNLAHPYQVIGHPIFKRFADEEKIKKALHTLRRKGSLSQCTTQLITEVGTKVPVTVDGILCKDEPNNAFLYITNISSIKKIESKLEDNRHLLQSIINNTLEAVIITNKSGKIIEWNPQAAKLLGQSKNNVINKAISSVIINSDDTHLFLEKDINNFLQNQSTKYINKREKFHIISKLNKKIPVASCCFPVLTAEGSHVFCFFLNDISLEIKLMTELEQSNQELQSFAYIASHDLKEPLRGIKNYAMILQDDYNNLMDDTGKNYLSALINSCSRLEQLLDSLLQYSKVGNLQLQLKAIDANQIIVDVKDSIHHMLKQKNATLVVNSLPKVMADESRLNEVFINLITNGLKYNDKANPQITLGYSLEKSNDELYCMYVRDNGIGIEQSKLNTVFQIFQRLHQKDEYGGGAGAGLTITKRIIERHNGSIWIESEPGQGTTFFFTLLKGDVSNREQGYGTNQNTIN